MLRARFLSGSCFALLACMAVPAPGQVAAKQRVKQDAPASPRWTTIDPNGPFDNEGLVKDPPRRSPLDFPSARRARSPWAGPDTVAEAVGIEVPSVSDVPADFHVPPSAVHAIPLDRVPQAALPAMDHTALILEDQANPPPGKMLRFGRERPLAVTMDSGAWYTRPGGGWVWAIDVISAGALGLRLHFSDFDLPEGAMVVVYTPGNTDSFKGPYLARGPLGEGQFWAGAIDGDTARIELYLPDGQAPGQAPSLRIDGLQHHYLDPANPNGGYGQRVLCGVDATCVSGWSTVENAVVGIGVINAGSLFCSGTMLATQANDLTPYVLTSRTAISSSSQAQNAEFYWRYQTSACNGAAPSLGTAPSSEVGTLLAASTNSDYSLLMVEGTLTSTGVAWAGWTTSAVPTGTSSICMHHGAGSYKQATLGTSAAATSAVCSTGSPNFIRLNWAQGSTDPGSGGAGIFNASQQLYGQLSCGPSTCSNPSFDNFGSFQQTYANSANIQSFLAAGTDDVFEANDTCATAAPIDNGTYPNLVLKRNPSNAANSHEDWYSLNVAGGDTLSVTLSFTHANGNIDAQLFDSCGGTVLATSAGTTNSESISYHFVGTSSNQVFLHVFLANDTRNTYSMTISGSVPVITNDSCSTATVITRDTWLTNIPDVAPADATASEPQESCEAGGVGVSNTVWYSFTPCTSGTATLDTIGSEYDTVLSVFTGSCASASQLACDDNSGGGTDSLISSLALGQGTTYPIKVSKRGAAGSGRLLFHFIYTPPVPGNDACSAAVVIPSNATIFQPTPYDTTLATTAAGEPAESCGFTTNSNSVWYSYTPCVDIHATIDTNGSTYDTVLSVFRGTCANAVEVGCNDDSGTGLNSQLVNFPLTGGITYLIKVADFGDPDGGCLTFNFTPSAPAPPNDSCTTPAIITSSSFHPPVYTTIGANAISSEPQESCEVGGVGVSNTVWYSITACGNGAANINTNGSDYDTVLSVFRGTCANSVQIACDDDGGLGANSQLTGVPMTVGLTYLIKVADYGGPNGGCLVFNFDFTATTPGNNACANAVPVGEGSTPFGTCASTTDLTGSCSIFNNIWFLYTASCTGSVTASTCSSALSYNSVLAVFQGSSCIGAQLGCNDNGGGSCGQGSSVTFPAVAGQQYRISIGGATDGATGSGTLTISCLAQCSPDFNHDGDVGTDADIEDFFHCLAGSCCARCDSADFNGDGDIGTDADIEAFFRVLSGGTC